MRVLTLGKESGRLRHVWRGLLVFGVLIVTMSVDVPSGSAQSIPQEGYWVDWDNKFGPQSFSWGWPYGNWYMAGHNYTVLDGQRQAGWLIHVLDYSYSGSNASTDFRHAGIQGFNLTPSNPHTGEMICNMYYRSTGIPGPAWAPLGSAAAAAKCQELVPGLATGHQTKVRNGNGRDGIRQG